MRPVLDRDFFPGLPKFLWFDDSDGGAATASAPGGPGAGPGTSTGTTTGSFGGAATSGAGGFGGSATTGGFGGSGTGQGGSTSGGGAGGATADGGAAAGGGPGSATGPGAATGGGGGTASGGSAGGGGQSQQQQRGGNPFGAVRGMDPSTVNAIIQAGLLGLGPGGALGGAGVGSPMAVLGEQGPGGVFGGGRGSVSGFAVSPEAVAEANKGLAPGGTQTGGISLAPTLGGQAPRGGGGQQTAGQTMGYPAIEGVSPGLTAAPAGPTQGYPSVIGPGGPNAPSAFASNAGGGAGGLAAAASNAQAQTNSETGTTGAAPSSPSQVGQSSPDLGSLAGLVASLVSGGAGGPALAQLAQMVLPNLFKGETNLGAGTEEWQSTPSGVQWPALESPSNQLHSAPGVTNPFYYQPTSTPYSGRV